MACSSESQPRTSYRLSNRLNNPLMSLEQRISNYLGSLTLSTMKRLLVSLGAVGCLAMVAAAPVVAATFSSTTASTTSSGFVVSSGAADPTSGTVTGSLASTSAGNSTLAYSAPASTALGTVSVSANGAFTYTPTATARHSAASLTAPASALTDTFTVTVSDGYGGVTAVPVAVTVSPQNSAPVAAPAKVTAVKPSTGVVTGGVSAVDPDGDSMTYSAPSSIPKGAVSVNSATGAFTYTPTAAARQRASVAPPGSPAKQASFTVTVTDGYGGVTKVPVKLRVAAP